MFVVHKESGRILGVEDVFATRQEVEDFLKAVEETKSTDCMASGYAHECREVEQNFYMIPAVFDGMETKGHTTLTEVDEKMAKDLWLQGMSILIRDRKLPKPVDDLEENAKNVVAGHGKIWYSMYKYPENTLRHTYEQIWQGDKKNWLAQFGEIHYLIFI